MIGYGQLRARGLSPDQIAVADATGRLHPVHPGVRALGYRRDDPAARRWAALLAAGSPSRLTGRSAVEQYALLLPMGGPIHLAVPRSRRFQRAGIVVHRPTVFREEDTRIVDGIPTTCPARALVELAACASAAVVRRAVHEALVRRLVTVDEVLEVLGPRSRRPGTRTLRRALGAGPVDLRSNHERHFVPICEAACIRAGVKGPEFNATIGVPWGVVEPDAVWRCLGLMIEIDGTVVHGTPLAFAEDRRRDRRLRALGWDVSRFPGDEVDERPDSVEDELVDLLVEASGRHGRPLERSMSPA